jgi:hypothetical protein
MTGLAGFLFMSAGLEVRNKLFVALEAEPFAGKFLQ